MSLSARKEVIPVKGLFAPDESLFFLYFHRVQTMGTGDVL